MTLKELLVLGLILFFACFARLFRLNYPPAMYFDEVYHVPAATLMSQGDFRTPFAPTQATYDGVNIIDWLHPPLAKYFQALSIHYFGKTPLFWRLPSLIFGLLSLVVFYFFLRFGGQHFFFKKESQIRKNELAINFALFGSFFLSLDGLFLVQSRIAMNDVFLLFFLLAGVFAYLVYLSAPRQKIGFLFLSGLLLGLALASKWTALWVILLLFAREFIPLKNFRQLPFLLFSLLFTPFFIYFLSYLPMLFAGYTFVDFLLLQKTIALSQLTNPNFHLYSSGPLSWLFNLKPVWYFATSPENLPSGFVANIYALGNPFLNLYLLLGLIVTFIFLSKQEHYSLTKQTILLLLTLYLMSFLPWLLFSRPMFIQHYLPALPFLIALSTYFLIRFLSKISDVNVRRAWTFNLLFWPLFCFVIFYPHWTALMVPESFARVVYFFIPSWQ